MWTIECTRPGIPGFRPSVVRAEGQPVAYLSREAAEYEAAVLEGVATLFIAASGTRFRVVPASAS